jgi:hypothetical protein
VDKRFLKGFPWVDVLGFEGCVSQVSVAVKNIHNLKAGKVHLESWFQRFHSVIP